MKKNQNIQERSPTLTESNPLTSRQLSKRINTSQLLATHPWLLVVGVGGISIAIALVAIFSLTHTGRVEKNPSKQTTIVTQRQTTPPPKSNSSPNWLPTIILLGAGVASTVAIYKWRSHLPTIAKRDLTRRQQRKLLLQKGADIATATIKTENNPLSSELETFPPSQVEDQPLVEPIPTDIAPIITVLPPEETQSSALGEQSLAEMMDIRKHLSLSAILQDFKR